MNKKIIVLGGDCFLGRGLKPPTLGDSLMEEIVGITRKYASRCDLNKIPCQSFWNKDRQFKADK